MAQLTFRPLAKDEFEPAYHIICETVDWLLSRNIYQWTKPLPKEIYRKRHDNGQNYGLIVDGQLAVVMSLFANRPHYWQEFIPQTSYIWLATLATSPLFRGQGIGKVALSQSDYYLRQSGVKSIFLDCSNDNDFLIRYYTSLGFKAITNKKLDLSGGVYDSLLMQKALG